jgi:hypothetical protein
MEIQFTSRDEPRFVPTCVNGAVLWRRTAEFSSFILPVMLTAAIVAVGFWCLLASEWFG